MRSTAAECAASPPGEPLFRPLVLSAREFALVSTLAREKFGVELGAGKETLVAARVGKLMRRLGYRSFPEYFRHVEGDRSGEALTQLIDALTTNHTSFFREPAHFQFLVERVFAEWAGRAMRIWSAACATGEEPYSIACTAREKLAGRSAWLPQIVASDISLDALATARKGMYKAERFPGGPAPWLRRHLLRGEAAWAGWYRMRPEILEMVQFRHLNLIEPLPDLGRFAVIFCRNVMIYFSRATQEKLVNRLAGCLEPGGYLFVGHAESLTAMEHGLEPVQPAIYRLRGAKR